MFIVYKNVFITTLIQTFLRNKLKKNIIGKKLLVIL